VTTVLLIIGSFLAGAVPTAYLMGRALRCVDIRTLGSGNVGATNVFRTLGKGPGVATLLIDILKGFLPVLAALILMPGTLVPVFCGLAAVAGHTWTPFLGFKGGKGVATSAGVFLALTPWPAAAALLSFLVAFGFTRHVSVGSLTGAAVLPATSFLMHGPIPAFWLALAVGVIILVRHASNIRRLSRGEEPGFKK
jgi:glycerol-3-phosphate acyltransferase PlsY